MRKYIFIALVSGIALFTQSCEKETVPETPILAIGDFHEGGVIFHIDGSGEHGFVCAVSDQGSEIEWGCPSLLSFGAKGLVIGTGAQNTQDIMDACDTPNIAAALCAQLELNGYDDWFLPSRDELDSLYQHKDIVEESSLENNGGSIHADKYWSSSHYLDNTVWVQHFDAGNQSSELKDQKNYVRAIRAF